MKVKGFLLIKGGRILDPATDTDRVADLLIRDGKVERISGISEKIGSKAQEVIPAQGKLVVPGLIDIHVHLREPGREDEETILSGSQAAVAGGFTAVACMANTHPPIDSQEGVRFVLEKANLAKCRIYPIAALTKGQQGEELSEIADLVKSGAVALSDDGTPVSRSQIMRRALEYSQIFGILIISHCEDKDLSSEGAMNESYTSTLLGLDGIPSVSEEVMVARDIQLAQFTGGRLHIAHLSTAGSLVLLREAKRKGVRVTAEVTPHHLLLSDELIGPSFDTNLKMNPPLRGREDIEALRQGLADGTIDCIVTDHAPHSLEEKDVEFDAAPFGIIGLETSLGLILTEIHHKGILDLKAIISLMSTNPAKVLGLKGGNLRPGEPADVTIIDLQKEWKVEPSKFKSKSRNTPFGGWNLKGKAVATIVAGEIVYREEV